MAIEMEGLEFQIETKAAESVKGVEALTKSLEGLKKVLKGGLGSSVKQLERLTTATTNLKSDKLTEMTTALKGLNDVKISTTISKRITEIGSALDNIKLGDIERLEDLGKALRDLKDVGSVKIPKVNVPKNIVPNTATPAVDPAAAATPVTSGVTQATSQVQEMNSAVQQATGRANTLRSVLSNVGGVFSKGWSAGTGVLQRLGASMSKLGAKAKSVMQTCANFPKSIGAKFASAMKQHTAGLGNFLSSLKRIAMYRLARFALAQLTKAFKDGINNLYQYSNMMGGQFASSMNSLATNALYLKNSLGAMAAPIINAIAPAIDFVIGKIVTLLNFINMLFARLSGASTFTAAKKNAQSYGDALSGAGGAASDAAKEIKNATTGIDELNMIMENDSSGGGGGGGGADIGSMFEEIPIDSNVSDFADRLKEAFDNADWKTLGTLLGDKVNELFDSVDWHGLGSKLGYGINAAVQTAYWFIDTVNFTRIGEHVAELLNGAFEQIDFSYVGRLFSQFFLGLPLIDILIGALTNLDWGLIAVSICDFIKGAFDEVTHWLNKYDWSELGVTLWENIKDFMTNVDWSGVATSIFTALGTAIRAAVQFLGGFFGSIGADIKTWWDKEIKGQNWKETGANILKWIGRGLVNIGSWVWTNIIDPFCSALIGEDKWASIKQAGTDLWNGFTKGITEFFANPGEWIKTNIVDPFVTWFKDLFGIHSPSTVMAEIGGDIIQGLLNGILAPFKAIGEWVNTHVFQPIIKAFNESPVVEFAVGVANTAADWWADVCAWWKGISDKGVDLSAAVTLVKEGWTTVKSWIGTIPVISQGINLIKNGWVTVKSWIGNLPTINQGISLIKNGWTTIKNWIGNVPVISQGISLLKSGWTTVKNWIGALPVISQLIALAKSGWSTVKSWINCDVVSVGISLFKSGWSSLSSWIGTSVSVGISLFKSGWSSIKSFFGLADGGIVGANGGVKMFASGGAINGRFAEMWNSVPKYAGGTLNAHGSMFVAGEAGAELVGHVNGRTEVLNKSQLGQVMHRSIVDGMGQFAGYWNAVNAHLTTCTNAVISAMLMTANSLYEGMTTREAYALAGVNDWVDAVESRVNFENGGAVTANQIKDGVREGMYEATAKQNELLREQNDLLLRLVNKETIVQIGNKTIKDAVVTQEKADGFKFTK